MAFFLIPEKLQKDFNGHQGFQDSIPGVSGSGIPSYARSPGYKASDGMTRTGARYFFPDPDINEHTGQPIPAAMGNKYDGGGAVYQQRVYAAAKDVGKAQGLKGSQIDDLKPRTVA